MTHAEILKNAARLMASGHDGGPFWDYLKSNLDQERIAWFVQQMDGFVKTHVANGFPPGVFLSTPMTVWACGACGHSWKEHGELNRDPSNMRTFPCPSIFRHDPRTQFRPWGAIGQPDDKVTTYNHNG